MPSRWGLSSSALTSELEQPRPDDAALPPALERGVRSMLQVGGFQDGVALGVGLHHPVLDAVVDHLHVVTGADRAGVGEAVLGRERIEDRLSRLRRPRRRRRPSGSSRSRGPRPRRSCRRRRTRCPCAASSSPWRSESWKLELPPSMTMSPFASRSPSSSIVSSVVGPAGTITQATAAGRRPRAAATSSSSDAGVRRPSRRVHADDGVAVRGAAARPCCRPSCRVRSCRASSSSSSRSSMVTRADARPVITKGHEVAVGLRVLELGEA